jgi:hypothetical protein
MEALPFGDEAFDAVIAANSLQYTANRLPVMGLLASLALASWKNSLSRPECRY